MQIDRPDPGGGDFSREAIRFGGVALSNHDLEYVGHILYPLFSMRAVLLQKDVDGYRHLECLVISADARCAGVCLFGLEMSCWLVEINVASLHNHLRDAIRSSRIRQWYSQASTFAIALLSF